VSAQLLLAALALISLGRYRSRLLSRLSDHYCNAPAEMPPMGKQYTDST